KEKNEEVDSRYIASVSKLPLDETQKVLVKKFLLMYLDNDRQTVRFTAINSLKDIGFDDIAFTYFEQLLSDKDVDFYWKSALFNRFKEWQSRIKIEDYKNDEEKTISETDFDEDIHEVDLEIE